MDGASHPFFYNKTIDNQTKQRYNITIELGRDG